MAKPISDGVQEARSGEAEASVGMLTILLAARVPLVEAGVQ